MAGGEPEQGGGRSNALAALVVIVLMGIGAYLIYYLFQS